MVTSLDSSPSQAGTAPVSRLPKSWNVSSSFRFANSAGIGPVNSLQHNPSVLRFASLPSSDGMPPDSPLSSKVRWIIWVSSPSDAGIGPVRLFPERCSRLRLASSPSSEGIGPVRLLVARFRVLRLARLPTSAGIGPDRPCWTYSLRSLSHRPRSSRPTTRPEASVLTPYHSLSGASLNQFSLSTQFGPSVALYSATSAARSGLWTVISDGSGAVGGGSVAPSPQAAA